MKPSVSVSPQHKCHWGASASCCRSPLKSSKKNNLTKVLQMLQRLVSCWSSSYRQRTGEVVGVNEGSEAVPPWSAAGEETAGCRGEGAGWRQQQASSQMLQEVPSQAAPGRMSPQWASPEDGQG